MNTLSIETIKSFAEASGTPVSDETAGVISSNGEFRMREIIQVYIYNIKPQSK
jgi:hypothetical protein